MIYTKQDRCIASIYRHINTEKLIFTEDLSPQAILFKSLEKLYAELDDFQKVAEHYFSEKISQQTKKEEFIGKGRCIL